MKHWAKAKSTENKMLHKTENQSKLQQYEIELQYKKVQQRDMRNA